MAAASSHASFTPVTDRWGVNGAGGEWNLYDTQAGQDKGAGIMEYIYGNFTRVDDTQDIQWGGQKGVVQFKAVYAGASQELYTANLSGTPDSPYILSSAGSVGTTPSRSGNIADITPSSQPFLFLDKANGNNAYSDPNLSSGKLDRMVTFAVTGYLLTPGDPLTFKSFADNKTHYILGFEDGTDMDYNDLVVEVSGVTPVPEPTTMLAGALLLLPFGASAMRILRSRKA